VGRTYGVIPPSKLLEKVSPPELAATVGTRIIASTILKLIAAAILSGFAKRPSGIAAFLLLRGHVT
jgi:hypothetical protein